ncbi:hypothetical protein M942_09280 [Enterobacter ludwigii]|nr:hypothetical protein M942_09280 [Enterobacter ludwigii]
MIVNLLMGWFLGVVSGWCMAGIVANLKEIRRQHVEFGKYFK